LWHHCCLIFIVATIATPTLLWDHAACKQCETPRGHCGIIAVLFILAALQADFHSRSEARATLLSSLSCCFLGSSGDHTRSFLWLSRATCHDIIVIHSRSQTLASHLHLHRILRRRVIAIICALRRLRLHCLLKTSY
jgi:hypothetical protein